MVDYTKPEAPGAFDFEAFSESTQEALELLMPIAQLRHSQSESKTCAEISEHAMEFLKAVKLGMGAARHGYTAAVDIISLAEIVRFISPEERMAYLRGTFEMAKKAQSEAQQAHDIFRDVRIKIFQLSSRASEVLTEITDSREYPSLSARAHRRAEERSLEDLRRGLGILERFGEEASALARWWDWIQVETQMDLGRKSILVSDEFAFEQNVGQWELLRKQFADYNFMVTNLEDSYPDLFKTEKNSKTLLPASKNEEMVLEQNSERIPSPHHERNSFGNDIEMRIREDLPEPGYRGRRVDSNDKEDRYYDPDKSCCQCLIM